MDPAPVQDPVPPAAAPRKDRESPLRLAAYVIGGAIAIYLATWVGPTAFYVEFQQMLLARETEGLRTVLGLEPSSSNCDGCPGWGDHEVGGARVPLPPGRLLEASREQDVVTLKLEEATITIAIAKPGSLASLYQEKLVALNVKTAHGLDDAGALREIAGECLSHYEPTMPEGQRQRYAARLLAKMSIWELRPVRHLDLETRGSSCAALVEHTAGDARVIVATESATYFVTVPRAAPEAWKASADCWLR
jgi:hypothetical protein